MERLALLLCVHRSFAMPSSPGTVSKILWHFTGGPKWDGRTYRPSPELKPAEDGYRALVGILKSKEVRLGSSPERLDVTLPEMQRLGIGEYRRHTIQATTRAFHFMPVCCLADIPIMHLGYHADRYGRIAIGYHRESILRAGFSPVFYQLQNSIALQSLFQAIHCLDALGSMDPAFKYGAENEAEVSEVPSNESLEDLKNRLKTSALMQARRSAVIAGAFIKTFDENEFESIYTEREWRSISPFKFEYADVSMVVLPRDGGYFERFVAEAESIGLPKTVSIVAWEDLVEH
jgi:Putative abortive phage resistance protein AbiGi, antitoxin